MLSVWTPLQSAFGSSDPLVPSGAMAAREPDQAGAGESPSLPLSRGVTSSKEFMEVGLIQRVGRVRQSCRESGSQLPGER